jgi:hypothetical protein
VEGQQSAEERTEVIRALLVLAMNDSDFLRDVRYAPASALSRYGFTLRNEEMDGVITYLIQNAGLSDEGMARDLGGYFPPGVVDARWH